MTPQFHTIATLKRAVLGGRVDARIHTQIEAIARKDTRDGKPFFELILCDAETKFTLRAWSDGPAFPLCDGLVAGAFLEVAGEFSFGPTFGVDAKRWTCRALDAAETEALLRGPPELREKQAADYEYIATTMRSLADPRLSNLAELFFSEYGDRFRRAAAARGNHHARRGGLVEHVAQMARAAKAIAEAYPVLNRDLLLSGVLFHDAGKLWENAFPPDGFLMPFDERGEMLGHITIGIELVNALWRRMLSRQGSETWQHLKPPTEDVRLHLLHLIAAHHGELQFGSPVPPKTPEAWALHHIDNLDAKLEMLTSGYTSSKRLAPRVQERVWPLPGNLISPLPKFGA